VSSGSRDRRRSRSSREKTPQFGELGHVGGVLVAPRLFTRTELRDKRATYTDPATVTEQVSHSLSRSGLQGQPLPTLATSLRCA